MSAGLLGLPGRRWMGRDQRTAEWRTGHGKGDELYDGEGVPHLLGSRTRGGDDAAGAAGVAGGLTPTSSACRTLRRQTTVPGTASRLRTSPPSYRSTAPPERSSWWSPEAATSRTFESSVTQPRSPSVVSSSITTNCAPGSPTEAG